MNKEHLVMVKLRLHVLIGDILLNPENNHYDKVEKLYKLFKEFKTQI